MQDKVIKLMFRDEARFGRISDVCRCRTPKPVRPICQAMMTYEYTCAYGSVDVCTGALEGLILPQVNTECMQLFLNEVSARHPNECIVMVIDCAGWHRSEALKVPANIYIHNRVFKSLDALENRLTLALKTLEDDAVRWIPSYLGSGLLIHF